MMASRPISEGSRRTPARYAGKTSLGIVGRATGALYFIKDFNFSRLFL